MTANADVKKALEFLKDRSSESVIVESGKTSTGWWRKWSDGFIEQGGRFTPTKTNTLVTLFQIYSDSNYLVFMQMANPAGGGWGCYCGARCSCQCWSNGIHV